MGVRKYQSYGRTLWKVDAWLVRPDGPPIRLRQSKIPTREQAVALEAKLKTDAFEGQFFERHRMATETTAELLAQYEKLGAQENRAWSTESGRAGAPAPSPRPGARQRTHRPSRRGVPGPTVSREDPAGRATEPGHAGPGGRAAQAGAEPRGPARHAPPQPHRRGAASPEAQRPAHGGRRGDVRPALRSD